jgi:hypothetical protein
VITTGDKGFLFVATDGTVSVDLMGYGATSSSVTERNIETINGFLLERFELKNGSLIGGRGVYSRGRHNVISNIMILDSDSSGFGTSYQTIMTGCVIDGASVAGLEIGSAMSGSGMGTIIERTLVRNINGVGISVQDNVRLSDVTIENITTHALFTGANANVSGLTVSDYSTAGSATAGVYLDYGSTITDSTLRDYLGTSDALYLRGDCRASHINLSGALLGKGIYLGSDSTLTHSSVVDTGPAGVYCSGSNTVKFNSIRRASTGSYALDAGSGNVIDQNRFYGSIRYVSNNVVTRNSIRTGSYQTTGVSNTVGPVNDINNPWSNFDK